MSSDSFDSDESEKEQNPEKKEPEDPNKFCITIQSKWDDVDNYFKDNSVWKSSEQIDKI